MKVSCAADSFQKQRPWTSSRAGATRCPHNRETLYHFLLELFFPLRFDFLLIYWAANGPLWEWKTPIPSGSVLPPAAPSFPGETGFLCGVRTVVGFHLWSGLLLGRWPWGTWASCGRWKSSRSENRPCLFLLLSLPNRYIYMYLQDPDRCQVPFLEFECCFLFFFWCVLFLCWKCQHVSWAGLKLFSAFPFWGRKDRMQNAPGFLILPTPNSSSLIRLIWLRSSVSDVYGAARINESAIIYFSSRCQRSSSGKRPYGGDGE